MCLVASTGIELWVGEVHVVNVIIIIVDISFTVIMPDATMKIGHIFVLVYICIYLFDCLMYDSTLS